MIDCPEKDLIIAVLQTALEDANGEGKVEREARGWIFRNSQTVFSFLWIADALGLDPQEIRRRIKKGDFSKN